MIVLAHPDDETVGAATLLRTLTQAHFVYITDGAPRTGPSFVEYRDVRRRERAKVFELCGLDASRIVDLDCPDQHASVRLVALARDLTALFDQHRVQSVLTHPYEGGHPDHDATAFAVHAAARLARQTPKVVEMTSYHGTPRGLVAAEFLPHSSVDAQAITVRLSPEERAFKRSLIEAYASQRDTLASLPLEVERFRPAPRYDFSKPPHEGTLWYETRDWGMTGARFRELAAQAWDELGLPARTSV